MRLFIRVKNGQPFEHPIFEGNFRDAFPDVDVNNLPEGFAVFERIQKPITGPYETYTGVTYEQNGDGYRDVHHFADMASDEIAEKKQRTHDSWADGPNWPSWTFNEETCSYDPPVAKPNDGNTYRWDEETISWVEDS